MSSISTPPCAYVTMPLPPMPPSSQANTPATPSSSTARCQRTLSSISYLNIVRWIILIISSVCLILDIIAIHALLSRPHYFHGPPLTAHQLDPNSQPPKPSFFSLLVFRLLPDIMVMSLMLMLLWRRIRLPNRLWSLHTLCRILFSTAIMVFALIYPITELRLVLEQNQGWAIYCQIGPSPPPQWGSDLRGVLLVSKGTIASRPQDGSLQSQDSWAQNCAVLRARSVLTVMWVLLILVEICIAYRAKEFHSRDDLCSNKDKHGHWSKAHIDRLIKASMDSSSEVSSEEIVRPPNDDSDEVDVHSNHESDYDYGYEETSTQYDLGQQRSSLQKHRYSHPPPEYHYAYRVEVLEPALPPFVYNPFMRQSDGSFTCLDIAASVTTGSSITISSIDSLDSCYGPYRTQNSEVSRPRHHGCL